MFYHLLLKLPHIDNNYSLLQIYKYIIHSAIIYENVKYAATIKIEMIKNHANDKSRFAFMRENKYFTPSKIPNPLFIILFINSKALLPNIIDSNTANPKTEYLAKIMPCCSAGRFFVVFFVNLMGNTMINSIAHIMPAIIMRQLGFITIRYFVYI